MHVYLELVERAFSPDVMEALDGSVALARELGVPASEVLDTREKISPYFLD